MHHHLDSVNSHLKVHTSQLEAIMILPPNLPILQYFPCPGMNTSIYLIVQAKNLGITMEQNLSLGHLL